MKIQVLLLPAVLAWWNPIKAITNKIKDVVTTANPSTKSDDYAHTRLQSTTKILNDFALDDVWLNYDPNGSKKRHPVSWTQHSRCFTGCDEIYWEFDYHQEHGQKKVPFRVFVAEEYVVNGKPPTWIHTQNAYKRLYMGFFPIDYNKPKGDHAVVFVYQPPNDREIYQKRFHFGMNDLVEGAMAAAGGAAGGAAAGAAAGAIIGSVIPGPGTALGAAIGTGAGALGSFIGGTAAKHFTNNYTGDFLRFVA